MKPNWSYFTERRFTRKFTKMCENNLVRSGNYTRADARAIMQRCRKKPVKSSKNVD